MRLTHPGGSTVHLAYCTNVHAAEDLAGVVGQLDRFAVPVREELGVDLLGLGLWLAEPVASALAADRGLRLGLRRELAARGLEAVTLNGFPYQAFQAPVVKHDVYYPDWTDRRRLRYTLELAAILADLLPDGAERGSISTLPLAWREPWTSDNADSARKLLSELSGGLAGYGGRIRVAFEPEPGCVVETTTQAVTALSDVDTDYLGVCLDLAHLACAWEDPAQAVARLDAAGIPIVKVQVSAALEIADPAANLDTLAEYAEPRFLHQTRSAAGAAFDDLPEALASGAPGPWRIHFHAPLHAAPLPPLTTSVPVLRQALAVLMESPACDHLEVETYTWGVLPDAARPVDDAGLARGIAAELAFARDELHALGVS
ncbi:sugar phosphate isomerase/epimerase [Allocatelliglobosispora scoriae]|uniref:Sugar phosphate isomerase/epimerase n=1 Tax=Allocatelliglobosispora scoriae TaxID=643052 RepID=A0A841BLE8_9ACTN|nr:metabolite traffic protein EboE [Allocatelliglobosispora scoriae]MBB5869114.1 sugar phosphate isomerase/epimerase [Allocatelliglobosispora scoriae]